MNTLGRQGVPAASGPESRLAELLLGLSAVADLGMGQPVGSAARTCFLAIALARAAGARERDVSDVFYAALLQHVGCTAYSHEATLLFADETSIKRASLVTDFGRQREVLLGYVPTIIREAGPGQKVRTAQNALLHGRALADGYSRANCEVASMVASRLGLSLGVQRGLLDIFEWWNGRGRPKRLAGEAISAVSRTVNVAAVGALFARLGGLDAARRAVTQRAGRLLDPHLTGIFLTIAPAVLAELDSIDVSDVLLDLEANPTITTPDSRLDEILRTFGDAVDLKAPFLQGHSAEVARLSRAAAVVLRLPVQEIRTAGQVGYVHDLGRAAVASGIWERTGAIGTDAWLQVRLHAYQSEQLLARSAPLVGLARLAGLHHERLDGSGYHRGALAAQLPMAARVLAAADVFQALTSPRPHRGAYQGSRAADELKAMAKARQLDPDAVRAVVAVAGDRTPVASGRGPGAGRTSSGAGGLTERQIEVLRLITRGLSNRAIAEHLTISPRTAEHHVQDIYARIGVSSRAAAAMYAMEHGIAGFAQPPD